MSRTREQYVTEVVRYVGDHLAAMTLPVQLRVDSVSGAQSDWRLSVGIDSTAQEGWFDFFEVLWELGKKVNERFKDDKWYFGVELLVPDRLIGERGLERLRLRHQQAADNDEHRRVRLRDNNG